MNAAHGLSGRSRSLLDDALIRLRRNRAAMASLALLLCLVAAAFVGPLLLPHEFDRVYSAYVKVPPQLQAFPGEEQKAGEIGRIAARMRATAMEIGANDTSVSLQLEAARPIDERLLAYFSRSDLFGEARVRERRDDGRLLLIDVPLHRLRFVLGTDSNGRDLLARILVAEQVSLEVGLLASLVALLIGVTWGALAGYMGGVVDMVMMRVVDILYALPFIFFVILLVVFFGRNFVLMFIAIGAIEWLDMARIVRGQTLSIKRQEYVQAALALGVDTGGILRRHIIPNTLGPVIIYLTLLIPRVILLESFLSFLGLGVQEPWTSLGVLIADGARNIQGASYLLLFPSLFFAATLLAFNFIGDGLRDALDPRDR